MWTFFPPSSIISNYLELNDALALSFGIIYAVPPENLDLISDPYNVSTSLLKDTMSDSF